MILKDYLEELSLEKAARVVSYMDSDDAVDVLDDLSETKKNEIVEHLDADAKEDVQKLLSYEDDEIGSCMTNNFMCIPDNHYYKRSHECPCQAGWRT